MKNTYKVNEEAVKKIAERVYDNGSTVINRNDLEEMFPELKESEDERIMKALIDGFKRYDDGALFNGCLVREIVACLEKQGEHADFRNKIQIGDKVTRNEDGVLVNLSQLKRVAKPAEEYNITGIGSKRAEGKLAEMIKELKPLDAILEKQDEQKPVEPQQDMLSQEKYAKAVDECIYGEQKPAWSEEDEKKRKRIMHSLSLDGTINNKDLADINDWLKSLKCRVQPQPQQEWSEEDERMITLLHNIVDHHYSLDIIKKEEQLKLEGWLKFLRPQNTWKPSDEQMYNLSEAAHYSCAFFDMEILKGLYDDLKKLREE